MRPYQDRLFERLQDVFQAQNLSTCQVGTDRRWRLIAAESPLFDRHIFAVIDTWAEDNQPQLALLTSFVYEHETLCRLWRKALLYIQKPEADDQSIHQIRTAIGRYIKEHVNDATTN